MILESVWDFGSFTVGIGSVSWDLYQIAMTGEGWGNLGLDTLGLVADVGAMLIPGLPGGASVILKAHRGSSLAHDAFRTIQRADTAANLYQAYEARNAAIDAFARGDNLGGFINLAGAGLSTVHFGIRGAQAMPDMLRAYRAQTRSGMLFSDITGGVASSRLARQTIAPKGKIEQHHSDPLFMGGNHTQKTTPMLKDAHRGAGDSLHSDLNAFLRGKTDGAGNHMRPQRGNSGNNIQNNFTLEERRAAMAEFYKQFGNKYPDAARDFFGQHPHLK